MSTRTLDHEALYRIFCRSVFQRTDPSQKDLRLLGELQALLRIPTETAEVLVQEARAEFAQVPDTSAGHFDPEAAYRVACSQAWADGELATQDRNLLRGLAQFLRLDQRTAQEILAGGALEPTPEINEPETPEQIRIRVHDLIDQNPTCLWEPQDDSGDTLLHQAARRQDATLVAELLAAGAPPTAQNDDGWTPLHVAAQQVGDAAGAMTGTLLFSGAWVDAPGRRGRRALHLAARAGGAIAVSCLLQGHPELELKEWDGGFTPLHVAAANDQLDVLRLLLEAGAQIEARNRAGATPLHLAASWGHREIVRELLQRGADVAACDSLGQTPLRKARAEGHFEAAIHLEARDAPDRDGLTGLEAGAAAKDPVALLEYSDRLRSGHGVAFDSQLADRALLEAHQAGSAEASFRLARRALRGDDGPPDPAEARSLLVLAGRAAGHPAALLELGMQYEAGEAMPRDEVRAHEYVLEAARHGSRAAMRRLARYSLLGVAVPPDAEEAMRWFRWAAELGDAEAMADLAETLEDRGDSTGAAGWARRAAEAGDPRGMRLYGHACWRGRGVREDSKVAKSWLEKAALRGDSQAGGLLDQLLGIV